MNYSNHSGVRREFVPFNGVTLIRIYDQGRSNSPVPGSRGKTTVVSNNKSRNDMASAMLLPRRVYVESEYSKKHDRAVLQHIHIDLADIVAASVPRSTSRNIG